MKHLLTCSRTQLTVSAGVIVLCLAGLPVWAQQVTSHGDAQTTLFDPGSAPASKVTLRAALDAAWQRAVTARETEGQRNRAEADRALASSLWAAPPSLILSQRDDRLQGNSGLRETEIGIAVPLWLPGQRNARAKTTEADTVQAQAAEHLARLRLAGELRESAWQLVALQAELTQADGQAQALKDLADDVERRVGAGDLARADALAAQAEYLASAALKADVQLRLQSARSRWTLLTGLTTSPDLASDAAEALPLAQHPEMQFASQSTELARQRLELMRRSRGDTPELMVGVRQDTPDRAESSQNSVVVGLRIPFGIDGRNRLMEASALAELDVARTHEQRLRERLQSDITLAQFALQASKSQLDAEVQRARVLRERATLIDKSFRIGEASLPDLLKALAAASQAESAAARQNAVSGLAHARLQQSLGLLP